MLLNFKLFCFLQKFWDHQTHTALRWLQLHQLLNTTHVSSVSPTQLQPPAEILITLAEEGHKGYILHLPHRQVRSHWSFFQCLFWCGTSFLHLKLTKVYPSAENLIYKKMSVSPAFKAVISSSHISLRWLLKSGWLFWVRAETPGSESPCAYAILPRKTKSCLS